MRKGTHHDAFTIYESWIVDLPAVPQRSELHSLQPLGVGTGLIECLTSYVSRLAASHCVSPSVLLSSVIAPAIGKKYWLQGGAREGANGSALSSSFAVHAKAINGLGLIAADWVRTVDTLTLRNDIEVLTMLPWKSVFSHRNLLRPTRAWCSACYDSWTSNGEPLYDPLLWTFRDVEVCISHERRLQSKCPRCNCQLRWLSRITKPGHCDKCHTWLGSPRIAAEPISSEELRWQSWIVSNLLEIINARNHFPIPITTCTAEALKRCIGGATDGVMNQFSSLIGKPKNTVWGWLQGNSLIPVNDLLRLCYHIELRLIDFMYSDEFVVMTAERLTPKEFITDNLPKRRKSPTRFDRTPIEQSLRTALQVNPPKPMTEISIQLKTHKRFLYRHFPSICKEIARKHKEYLSHEHRTLRESKSRAIIDIRNQLTQSGLYPSRRRISNIARSRNVAPNAAQKLLRGKAAIAA